jgi:hypothetical protein
VVIGTDAFVGLAREAATALGMPNLSIATVPHPIGGVDPRTVAAKAERIVDEVADLATRMPEHVRQVAATATPLVDAPEDLDRFQEFAVASGWSDGLPVLPPTPERVERVLGRFASRRWEVIAPVAPRLGEATLEAIATNAALAGAGPSHFPAVIGALRALTRPEFNLEAVQTTTHPCGPFLVFNGPIVRRLGIAAGANALGGGARANAVIGRAVRFVLVNVGGARPGSVDRATLGHPGKYSYCLGENEEASPWEPLHVERGFPAGASCVTVCGSEAPHNVNDHGSTTAEALLRAIAGTAATPGSNNVYLHGEPLVLLGPEHAQTIAASGWSKTELKRRFWESAQVPVSAFSAENVARFAVIDPARFRDAPPDRRAVLARTPDDVMIVVAGGPGKHSAIVPTFGATRSVTVRIEDS